MKLGSVARTIFLPFGSGVALGPAPIPGGSFRATLVAKLLSIPDLTARIATAVYPGALPQTHDVWRDGPALVYLLTTYPRNHVLIGSDGTATAEVALYAMAATE